MKLIHKHVLITATGLRNPPRTPEAVTDWLLRLVQAVDMRMFFGPFAKRCEQLGNEGVTGMVCIETSHASLHCWDTIPQPFVQIDLYSCQEFDEQVVLNMVGEFSPIGIDLEVVDRTPWCA